jgi:thioredoxin-like negative regulator of GroEL
MNRLPVLAGVAASLAFGWQNASAQIAGVWTPPACKLNTKHFLANSAQLYLKNATQAKNPEQRQKNLTDAERVLKQAVAEGQADNPAIWYFYGRYYLLIDDMRGADTAFAKAQRGQADCADDIDMHRRNAWVPHVQTAADALNRNDYEAAKGSFRKANDIYQGEPLGFYYLANVFISDNQLDSAIHYFRRSAEVTNQADTSQAEIYETSVFNLARLYHQNQQWDSAAGWYEKYREIKPGDMQAVSGLALVYDEAGKAAAEAGDGARAQEYAAKSSALYGDVLASTDSVSAMELFSVGISLFRSGSYPRAAEAFEAVRRKNPYYRDALYNLASTYLSMGSSSDTSVSQAQKDEQSRAVGEKMLPVARQMVSLDPYNRNSLRMLAVAFQYLNQNDSVLLMLEAAEGLPFEVTVNAFQPSQEGYMLQGTVTALESRELTMMRDSLVKDSTRLDEVKKNLASGRDPKTNRPIPAAIRQALQAQQPVLEQRVGNVRAAVDRLSTVSVPAITFDFVTASGQVVSQQTVPGAALPAGQSKDFSLTASGEDIEGWRYKAGS